MGNHAFLPAAYLHITKASATAQRILVFITGLLKPCHIPDDVFRFVIYAGTPSKIAWSMISDFATKEIKLKGTVLNQVFNELGMMKHFDIEIIALFKHFITDRAGSNQSMCA